MKRNVLIRKVNPKRRKSEFARTYHSKERVEWVKSLPCVWATSDCRGPVDNAHVVTDGMGRKADYDKIAPLCRYHHGKYDTQTEYKELARLNLLREAARIEALWAAFQETTK